MVFGHFELQPGHGLCRARCSSEFPETTWFSDISSYSLAMASAEPGVAGNFHNPPSFCTSRATACRWKCPKTTWFLEIPGYSLAKASAEPGVARNCQKNHLGFGNFELQPVAGNFHSPPGFGQLSSAEARNWPWPGGEFRVTEAMAR